MDDCALYADPELYDLLFPDAASASAQDAVRKERLAASEQFYLEEARRGGGRVLELGCGSGRLTLPIAQSGIEIVGADLSESMLEAARAKSRASGVDVQFVQADMRCFNFEKLFSAILIPGNSLLHLLTIEDLKQCLACVRRHFAPGGELVFDISKWDLAHLMRDPKQRYPVLTVNQMTVEESAAFDAATQVRHIKWFFSRPDAPDFRAVEYKLRVIFPQELSLLLEASGFRLDARCGEFPRQPFHSNSPRQVCICSLATTF